MKAHSLLYAALVASVLLCGVSACPFARFAGDDKEERHLHRHLLQGGGRGPQGKQPQPSGPQGKQPRPDQAVQQPADRPPRPDGPQGKQPRPDQAGQQPADPPPRPDGPQGKQPGGGGQGGGGGNRPPPCDLAAAEAAGPLSPKGPPSQTSTDLAVKKLAVLFLDAAMRTLDGGANTSLPLGGFLRAAFHDAGTYNRETDTGGANGSLRREGRDRNHRGLQDATRLLSAWRREINSLPDMPAGVLLSYADMYQLAGAVAVEVTGGAEGLVDAVPVGREDSNEGGLTDQLPSNANARTEELLCLFVGNGYTVKEMVALTGAHTIGFKRDRRAPDGRVPLSATPFEFNLDFWVQLLTGRTPLRSDTSVARADPALSERYATDESAFFNDFIQAYVKMGKMGATWASY